jgi:hypothetical protein
MSNLDQFKEKELFAFQIESNFPCLLFFSEAWTQRGSAVGSLTHLTFIQVLVTGGS